MTDISTHTLTLLDGEFLSDFNIFFFLRLEAAFQVMTTSPDETSQSIPQARPTSQTCDPSLIPKVAFQSIVINTATTASSIQDRQKIPTPKLVDIHAGTVPRISQTNETSIPPYMTLS